MNVSPCRCSSTVQARCRPASGSPPRARRSDRRRRTCDLAANAVDLEARITESGVNLMEVHISSAGAEQVLFSQAVTVRQPRVLYVAGGRESSPPLLETLKTGSSGHRNGDGLSR